jgi:hypothetical protein
MNNGLLKHLDGKPCPVILSIKTRQGAFLTVAPAEARKRTGLAGGKGNNFFVVRILKKVVRK